MRILKSEITITILLLSLSLILELIRPLFLPDIVQLTDTPNYIKIIEFFRGNGSLEDVDNAFRARILVPLIASLLPWDPFFNLTAVNIAFTLLTVFIFNRFLLYFNFEKKIHILGSLLFIFAGPTIIDGSDPGTDSAGIFFMVLSLYLYSFINKQKIADILIGVVIGIGTLAREPVVFIAPVLILWRIIDKDYNNWKNLIIVIISIGLIPIMFLLLLKIFIPADFVWTLNFDTISSNISHLFEPLTLSTIAQLTLMLLVGLFGNYQCIFSKSKNTWKLIIGILVFFSTIMYFFLSAAIASRFFWPFYIFIIPFFLLALKYFGNNTKEI